MGQPALTTDPHHDQLLRARGGDRDALRAVAERWWPRLRRWAWLELGDRQLAEDGVQEAMVRLVRFVHQWDPARPFGPWVHSLVRSACRDVARRTGKHTRREVAAEHGDGRGHPSTVERRLDLQRSAQRARDAVAELSARQRQLWVRVDVEGAAPSEVARELGLSPGAVRNQLHTARRALRARLLSEGSEVLQLLKETP